MAKRIYKYPVPTIITAPVNKWLDARIQDNHLMVWAELDDDCKEMEWVLVYIGTGWEIEKDDELYDVMQFGTYCGSVEDGPYIWHVYACPKCVVKDRSKEKNNDEIVIGN